MLIRASIVLALALTALAGCGDDGTTPTPNPPQPELACSTDGYPCTLADVPPAVLDGTLSTLALAAALPQLTDPDSALAWLAARPDMAEAQAEDGVVRFRLAGGAPAWILDLTGTLPSEPAAPQGAKSVVGEDTDGNATVDNRDAKRALVLAPFLWQFHPYDESDLLAGQIRGLRGYADDVVFHGNENESSRDVLYSDFLDWDDYDLVYLSTHGGRVRLPDGIRTSVVIDTGIPWDLRDDAVSTMPGVVPLGLVDRRGGFSNAVVRVGLTEDFFRTVYPDGLDDALVVFSACKSGAAAGNALAEALAGRRFVMLGWSENVPSRGAFDAAGLLMEKLGQGLAAETALQMVTDAGLNDITNSAGLITTLQHFAPDGGDVRLFEIPRLLTHGGAALTDGASLLPYLIGTPGDGAADHLQLVLEVDGVTTADLDDFSARYEFAGVQLAADHPLAGGVSTNRYSYRVNHLVDLGFDVAPGASVPLAVAVALPEGGASRFHVDVAVPDLPGDGGHDCTPYTPTPVANAVDGQWQDPGDDGFVQLGTPGDPGGGYWLVTAATDEPAVGQLSITDGPSGAVFSGSNLGEPDPQTLNMAFEAAPGRTYTARWLEFSSAPAELHPFSWSVSYTFMSVMDCYEPNQSSLQAKRLPLDVGTVTAYMIAGYRDNALHAEDYEDWYRFEAASPTELSVELVQSPSDMRMRLRLWSSGLSQLENVTGSGPGDLVAFTHTLQPGVYYLSAEAADFNTGAANLDIVELPDHLVTPYRLQVSHAPAGAAALSSTARGGPAAR